MLTGKEKRSLRAMGNQLKTEIWIGKVGVSEGTFQAVENAFNTKELIKIKLLENCPLPKREVAGILSAKCRAELVQILGNTILLFRPLPEA